MYEGMTPRQRLEQMLAIQRLQAEQRAYNLAQKGLVKPVSPGIGNVLFPHHVAPVANIQFPHPTAPIAARYFPNPVPITPQYFPHPVAPIAKRQFVKPVSYKKGVKNIKRDTVVILHKGESVIPAKKMMGKKIQPKRKK